jgi:hypothetical protein
MKTEESRQIYYDWLAGKDIADLAREYRHWRCTIESTVKEYSLCSELMTISCAREAAELKLAIATREFARRAEMDDVDEAQRWYREYQKGISVLVGKN